MRQRRDGGWDRTSPIMPKPGCRTRAINSFKSRYPSGTCRPTAAKIRAWQCQRHGHQQSCSRLATRRGGTVRHGRSKAQISGEMKREVTASRGRAKRFLARRTGSPPGAAPSSASHWASSSMRAGPRTTTDIRTGSRMLAESGHIPNGCGGAYLPPSTQLVLLSPSPSPWLYVTRWSAVENSVAPTVILRHWQRQRPMRRGIREVWRRDNGRNRDKATERKNWWGGSLRGAHSVSFSFIRVSALTGARKT